MSYPVAEETVAGYLTHIFESCDEFQKWAKDHPGHGEIKSRSFAGISGRPIIGTIDHRADKRQEAEAPAPVENERLF